MDDLVYLNSIPITVPRGKIYRRLGDREGITKIMPQQKVQVEQFIEEAKELIDLKGAVKRIAIQEKKDSTLILSKNIIFESRHLSALLKDCGELIIMAATAGKRIMDAIQEDSAKGNLTRVVVLDAAASEIADASFDWITSYFNQQLRRENKRLTKKRVSAGYGDFLLENQEKIFNILKLDKLGISITSGFMLQPQKSVTAVAGILRIEHGA